MLFLNFALGVLVVVVMAIILFSAIALANKTKQSKIAAANMQIQVTGTTKPKKNFWSKGKIIWAIIGLALVIGGAKLISNYNNCGPGLPRGKLMETAADSADWKAALAETAAMTTEEKSSSPRISKELLSTTSDFNFDDKVIRFKYGEKRKIITLEPGKTSPKVFIPQDKYASVKLIDSTEIWCQSGVKYMDTPDARNKLPDRVIRFTGRQPVRIVLR